VICLEGQLSGCHGSFVPSAYKIQVRCVTNLATLFGRLSLSMISLADRLEPGKKEIGPRLYVVCNLHGKMSSRMFDFQTYSFHSMTQKMW